MHLKSFKLQSISQAERDKSSEWLSERSYILYMKQKLHTRAS